MQEPPRRWVGALRRARQHRDRVATGMQRALVRGGVHAAGHATDHGHGSGNAPGQGARVLQRIRRRAASPDDRHRVLGHELQEPLEPAGDVQDGRLPGEVPQLGRIGRITPAQRLDGRRIAALAVGARVKRLPFGAHLGGAAAAHGLDEVLVGAVQQLRDPLALVVQVARQAHQQPGAPQAVRARSRRAHADRLRPARHVSAAAESSGGRLRQVGTGALAQAEGEQDIPAAHPLTARQVRDRLGDAQDAVATARAEPAVLVGVMKLVVGALVQAAPSRPPSAHPSRRCRPRPSPPAAGAGAPAPRSRVRAHPRSCAGEPRPGPRPPGAGRRRADPCGRAAARSDGGDDGADPPRRRCSDHPPRQTRTGTGWSRRRA